MSKDRSPASEYDNRLPGGMRHPAAVICALLLAASAALSAAARMIPGFAQWYSVTVYPLITGSLGRLSGLFPFSVGEILCIALPLALAAYAAHSVISCRHKPDQARRPLVRIISRIMAAACILVFMYTANCGVNYYREPFTDPEILKSAQFTEDDLVSFCEYALNCLDDIYREEVPPYPQGKALSDAAVKAMEDLSESNSGLSGYYPRPKMISVIPRLFSMMGVSGIYSPFTAEANVNGEMPGLEMPFTSCHELSHLRGYMNESEANFIGWLACIGSEEPSFNRSGWLIAWLYAGNSLYRADPEKYYELRKKLPDEAVRELDENDHFWSSHENKASEVQDRVNDAYLRSNGQENGIRSYSMVTTLMLDWYADTIPQQIRP